MASTNYGDVIASARSDKPFNQGSIVVHSAGHGPSGVRPYFSGYDNFASGIAQDLTREGLDIGYYSQYDEPDWFFVYRSEDIQGSVGAPATGWFDSGPSGIDTTDISGLPAVDLDPSVVDTFGFRRRTDAKYWENSVNTEGFVTQFHHYQSGIIESLNSHDTGTIFIKVNMDAVDNQFLFEFEQEQSAPASGGVAYIQCFALGANDSLRIGVTSNNGVDGQETVSWDSAANTFTATTWHRIGIRQDGINMRLWVDGDEIAMTITGTTDHKGYWIKNIDDANGSPRTSIDFMSGLTNDTGSVGIVGKTAFFGYANSAPSDGNMARLTGVNTSTF